MNSEILCITRRLGFPSSFGVRSGLGDFLDQYPDGIYAESGIGAPIGWESAAVWFGGESERASARFERMVAERNDVSRLFRTRVAGTLVITFLYRLKRRAVTAVPVGGAHEPLDPDVLNFTMPNGGTISLNKTGSPTVVELEYWLSDDNQWRLWEADSSGNRSLTLTAGQTMYVRNTSETSTGFSIASNYYRFGFTDDTYADGHIGSLLCKNYENAVITDSCYRTLFYGCSTLKKAPKLSASIIYDNSYAWMFRDCTALTDISNITMPETLAYNCCSRMFQNTAITQAPELPATILADDCYYFLFADCVNLSTTPTLPANTIPKNGYYSMFLYCGQVNKIVTNMLDISASNATGYWLTGVAATGDLYCDPNLTISVGTSGIPNGWTRHDLSELS